ncbi:MAG TPA: M28 family peptidase, partial [Dehalococcoidia bacterium]|nr:M28 family peptidase [Dehalococcoidia bacterium]
MPIDAHIPTEQQIYGWIQEVFDHGVRRPGYAADRWAEAHCLERFRALGLEKVRHEPVELPSWEPRSASLRVTAGGEVLDIDCMALPHSTPLADVEAPLVAFDATAPERVKGAVAMYEAPLMRMPHKILAGLASWVHDPGETFAETAQVLPFAREIMGVMEPAMAAGAAGFIGVLKDYPGDSKDYYVPYDAVARPLPGVWVRGSDGARLAQALASGPVTARLTVDSVCESITTFNVVGELPGADDETVIIGSHHDGPWSSAVEDGSGIALVLAQAEYWSRVPQQERPHQLVFLLNSGHMAGGAGCRAFVEAHRGELQRTVLEVHLEHAANEFAEVDGELRPTGHPEARWWFTTRILRLEASVKAAI